MKPAQHAVVYDCDSERAAQVSAVLRKLGYQAMVVDHAALVGTMLQASGSEQLLFIGDVSDSPNWNELGGALRGTLCDIPVVSYGSAQVAMELSAVAGQQRVVRLKFPFNLDTLASALHLSVIQTEQETNSVHLPSGTSNAVREVNRLIKQVAAHGSSVLILGESGSGKEVVARAIHDASPRRQRPFVAINCGAIPSELLESELFGHEKGSFTGAVTSRKGRFEIAEGGTLFLDEIGDMSMTMQVKLLRVLQERVFERIGGHAQIRCNVRIIAATHRNLEEAIIKGAFREDLFYRLNVFPIEMPPLRSRLEDMGALVREFIESNVANGRARLNFKPGVMDALLNYGWPGNVRELGNLIERLSILCPHGMVSVNDLPARYRPKDWVDNRDEQLLMTTELMMDSDAHHEETLSLAALTQVNHDDGADAEDQEEPMLADEHAFLLLSAGEQPESNLMQLPATGIDLRSHLYDIERGLIRQAMERAGGTVAHAARLLQLRRTTLVEKLRKFEMLNDHIASEV